MSGGGPLLFAPGPTTCCRWRHVLTGAAARSRRKRTRARAHRYAVGARELPVAAGAAFPCPAVFGPQVPARQCGTRHLPYPTPFPYPFPQRRSMIAGHTCDMRLHAVHAPLYVRKCGSAEVRKLFRRSGAAVRQCGKMEKIELPHVPMWTFTTQPACMTDESSVELNVKVRRTCMQSI